MTDPAAIAAAFGSIKTAVEIVKVIREGGTALKDAEVKLKLADLVGALADARMELAEVEDTMAAKDARIAELMEAFEAKDELRRVNDAMYATDAAGSATGDPYCLRCWDVDHRQRPLIHKAEDHRVRVCPQCRTEYEGRRASRLAS